MWNGHGGNLLRLDQTEMKLKIPFVSSDKKKHEEDEVQSKSYWDDKLGASLSDQWTANPVIGAEVYKRMSGGQTAKHWLHWIIEDYFAGKKFNSLLSPGCGTGAHELLVARSGLVKEIDAFDFSLASLEVGRQKAAEAGLQINFYQDNLNSFVIADDKKYDLVMCSGSLHHTRELERFLSTVRAALNLDGYFIVNEYVGDCYNIYDQRKVDILNRLYECFPASLRSGKVDKYRNPTIQEVLAADPSESVRSKLILPLLREYFDITMLHPYGGQLLHTLYQLINHREFIKRDDRTELILRLVLEFEAILMELPGGLETDFALCVCRPKC